MAKPITKRKKQYRKRDAVAFGGLFSVSVILGSAQGNQTIKDEDQTDTSVACWMAFKEMVYGKSSETSWSTIACALNVSLVLAEWGMGKEYEPYLVKALDGVFRARMRADRHRHRVWRFDGEAISSVREALEIYDEQIKLATKQEMRDALNEVLKRIANNDVYKEAA